MLRHIYARHLHEMVRPLASAAHRPLQRDAGSTARLQSRGKKTGRASSLNQVQDWAAARCLSHSHHTRQAWRSWNKSITSDPGCGQSQQGRLCCHICCCLLLGRRSTTTYVSRQDRSKYECLDARARLQPFGEPRSVRRASHRSYANSHTTWAP